MTAGSCVVVNNRVVLRDDPSHATMARGLLRYISSREGAVRVNTEDDLRARRESRLMAELGYIEFRPGSVAGGAAGHALFDASGVPDRAAIRRELAGTKSAVITTVVAVRRRDAEGLRLSTKQDWERFLRSQWPRYLESLGVMRPQDVRWVAAFHANQRNNLHCHVITWDSSGEFNRLLPNARMARANAALRAHALRPQQEALDSRRTLARDEAVLLVRSAALDEDVRGAVASALPSSGSLKHARLSRSCPEAARAIDGALDALVARDRRVEAMRGEYLDAVRENARAKGLSPQATEAYVSAARDDLDNRLANALIANVRGADAPAEAAATQAPALGGGPLPEARRRAQALEEEADCCLGREEERALRLGLLEAAAGVFCQQSLSRMCIGFCAVRATSLRRFSEHLPA